MKTFLAGLQNSISAGTYSSTQTSALGRAVSKTINSQAVIGPAVPSFIDVFTQTANAPTIPFFDYQNNRLYILSSTGANNPQILLYNFNASSGAYSYVGKVIAQLPNSAATTYTFRGFKVLNVGAAIHLVIFATGSVAINGGTFLVYNLSTSNFTSGGSTYYPASGSGQSAVYFLQDYDLMGVLNTLTTAWGGAAPFNASTSAYRTRIYQFNGTLALPQIFSWDLALGSPNVSGMDVNGISCVASTPFSGTSPSAYFNMGPGPGGYSGTLGDPVVVQNGTTAVPTGLTAWVSGTSQTTSNVYFMRDVQQQVSFTIPALPNQYSFTVTATTAPVYPGAQYTNNAVTFTVPLYYASAVTTVVGQGSSAPLASGTLTAVANQYGFTTTATTSPIGQGATYTNNGFTFTAQVSLNTGTTLFALTGTGAPTASGTLTLASGTGPATIAFSASTTAGQASITFSANAATTGITAAATYTNNGFTFTVPATVSSGATTIAALVGPPGVAFPVGQLTLSSGTGVATISFTNNTAGNTYFNLSATSGAAAITPTSTSASFTLMRAFGTSSNLFYGRTANYQALSGTLLQTNTVDAVIPTNPPLNPALGGLDCLTLTTSTSSYLGKISDLFVSTTGTVSTASNQLTVASTSGLATGNSVVSPAFTGGTTITAINGLVLTTSTTSISSLSGASVYFGTNNWASLTTSNLLGTGIDVVAPTAAYGSYSNELDKVVYQDASVTGTFVIKPLQNSGTLTGLIGGGQVPYYEGNSIATAPLYLSTMAGMDVKNGWLFVAGSATGQRGIFFIDLYSDYQFGYSSIISPVQYLAPGSIFKYIDALQQLFAQSNQIVFSVRNGASSSDPNFATVTSGTWTPISRAADLSSTTVGPYFQIRAQYNILNTPNLQLCLSTVPAQINDFIYTAQLPGESSIYWAAQNDQTTQSGVSPEYVCWRLGTAYATSVPTLYVRGYDDLGNLVSSFNTSTSPTVFSYSTNNGTSWNSLGTIPNTTTTLVRILISSPPVTASGYVSWSIAES